MVDPAFNPSIIGAPTTEYMIKEPIMSQTPNAPFLGLVDPAHQDNPAEWVEVIVYKADRRRKDGRRAIFNSVVHQSKVSQALEGVSQKETRPAYRLVSNLMTGQPYWEPYSTPHYCSASSEAYWSS